MSDTAAFFASKKKKKKAFKFNANLVDASTVTPTVHVDAPALSTDQPDGGGSALSGPDATGTSTSSQQQQAHAPGDASPTAVTGDGGWDDEAMAAATVNRSAAAKSATGTTVEVLDMKSLDPKKGGRGRNDQANIAEKLRVEETKAQLAAAREGMERQAALLKEEKEAAAAAASSSTSQRFATAAASMGGGGKWVPPHMRSGGAGASAPLGVASRVGRPGQTQKLNVEDEELFPDLAAADKILEKKERESQPAFRAPKKTPVGGGASWASKPVTKPKATKQKPAPITPPATAPEPKKQEAPPQAAKKETPQPEPQKVSVKEEVKEDAAPTEAAPGAAKPKKPKKKKKDLSTFKPGGGS